MALQEYRRKRDPDRTPEPFGRAPLAAGMRDRGMFVIQKHSARALHYDFRLEMEGVLRSWAIPKGPSLNPRDKRLAVMVEDHPVEYADFEGTIPEGNYGAGAVIVWDRGEYRMIDPPGDAADAVRAGKLDLEMHGFKLHGAFTLVRTRGMPGARTSGKEQWLLIKKRDGHASDDDVTVVHPRSIFSGLTVEQMPDHARIGVEITREVEAVKAPRLRAPLEPNSFPVALARITDNPFDSDGWLFELKYDGVRALAIRDRETARIFGRNLREITERYPEVALALRAMPFDRFVIDGEIIVPDESGRPSFQLLQRRINVTNQDEIRRMSLAMPVYYHVFDLLAFDEFDLRPLGLETRKQLLARMVNGEGPIRYCDHIIGRGREFYEAVASAGLEGIVAKRRNAPYHGARSGDWLKIKCPRRDSFVIGGWTDPAGSRAYFGALLIGQYDSGGDLRFVSRVGTGFDETKLTELYRLMKSRERSGSPFRKHAKGETAIPRSSHFCEPSMVCEVQFAEWTNDGGIRHPSFKRLIPEADPRGCVYGMPGPSYVEKPLARSPDGGSQADTKAAQRAIAGKSEARPPAHYRRSANRATPSESPREFVPTNLDKIFWPSEGYTKGDLIRYYAMIAPWMLPYLKDRPVVLTRYPDGIEGKSFFQKDAPGFVPSWIRTEQIYSEDSHREISYFVLESAEAIAYMANLGAIPIHIWSSRLHHLERPDWLLFDIDPKNSTTRRAVAVAREVASVLREVGMRPYLKTSGQMGLHVVVGLTPEYTYEQARMFSQLVAREVVRRIPDDATLSRDINARSERVYIDYLQLGQGKTIAAPFAARPVAGAPVSAPLDWKELRPSLDPARYNIKTMPPRMKRIGHDPFIGAINDQQRLEDSLHKLEEIVKAGRSAQKSK